MICKGLNDQLSLRKKKFSLYISAQHEGTNNANTVYGPAQIADKYVEWIEGEAWLPALVLLLIAPRPFSKSLRLLCFTSLTHKVREGGTDTLKFAFNFWRDLKHFQLCQRIVRHASMCPVMPQEKLWRTLQVVQFNTTPSHWLPLIFDLLPPSQGSGLRALLSLLHPS